MNLKIALTATALVVALAAPVATPAVAGGFGGSDRSAPGPFNNVRDQNLSYPQRFASGFTRYVANKKITKLNYLRRNGYIDRRYAIEKIKEIRGTKRTVIDWIRSW